MARSERKRTTSTRPAIREDEAPEIEETATGDVVLEDAEGTEDAFDGFDDEISPRRRRPADPARTRRGETAAVDEDADDAEDAAASRRRRRRGDRSTPVRTVPEAAKDSSATDTARARRAAEAERTGSGKRRVAAAAPNPAWLVPTAVTLLILGLVYLVVYYLAAGQLPLPIGQWNLLVGFGVMMVGGALLMRWK